MSRSRGSRWSVVAAFSLVAIVTQMIWLTLSAGTTVAASRYGVSVAAIGWLANIMVAGCVVLSIPGGLLLDRHFKAALAIGSVLVAAGACVRLGGTYPWLLAGYIVAALGQPIIFTAITGLARNYLAPKDGPRGIAIATGSQWVGYMAAFGLGAVFSTRAQLPTLFAIDAVVAVVAAIAMCATLMRPAPYKQSCTSVATDSALRGVARAWSDPLLRLLVLYMFVPFGVYVALTTWAQALLEPAGVSVGTAGVILIASVVAGIAGTALLPEPIARHGKQVALGVVGAVLTSVMCVVLAIAPSGTMGIVALAVIGFSSLPILAVVLEVVERLPGHGQGVATGWIWTAGNLGGVVTTAIVGFTVGGPALSFVLLATISLLALPLLWRLMRPLAALPRANVDEGLVDGSQSASPLVSAEPD